MQLKELQFYISNVGIKTVKNYFALEEVSELI